MALAMQRHSSKRLKRSPHRRVVMRLLIASLFLLEAVQAFGQVPAAIETSDLASSTMAAGSSLKHFSSIDNGVFKGSRPKSDADYRFLQSLHVKYIVDLQVIPLLTRFEQRKAKKYGITVIPGTMNASPFSPSEKHIDRILTILRDERYRPVYFHCKFGRDRTSIIAALYKMYFLGMSQQEAVQYLHDSGYAFKYGWVRSGLTRYLKNHPTSPIALNSAASKR
jgi:protein-tyrosine phosphatase